MRAAVDNRIKTGLNAEFTEQDNELLETTRLQIDEYLKGNRTKFELPLLTVGTDFQKSVWNALLEIPYGSTSTYLELAKSLNHEKAVRAVASANGANSLSIVIPCHRIIESNGGLGGYAGGIPIKKRLLELERIDHTLSDDQKYDFIGSKDKKYNGSFFTAVKTTGIYCLPSCSARKPKRENIVFYDTKEEAILSGFRACKVCKP
jgi:methylated-DNA-[protein]-cysteine S-methyltransferase